MNLNKNRKKSQRYTYDGTRIIKKGSKELYPIVYLREFDFRDLSYYKSRKYGIDRKIYKYIGVSEDYNLRTRTSKWTNKNLYKDNKIGQLLRAIMKMERLTTLKELNQYLEYHITVLRRYETIKVAKELESSLISINMWEEQNLGTVCLNTKDNEVEVKNGKYILNY